MDLSGEGWQLIEDRFVSRTDVARVGVTEDLKLGWSSYLELGWSSDAIGGDGEYLLGTIDLAFRDYLAPRHLWSARTRLSAQNPRCWLDGSISI